MVIKERKLDTGSPLTGNLVFYQNMIPPLSSDTSGSSEGATVPGSYQITVDQTVFSTGAEVPETTYQNTHKFVVRGPRFTLPVGLVTSVYPPEGAEGEYANVLAHACFSRGTLPWERHAGNLSAEAQTENVHAESDQAPWLGVLLLYSTDPTVTFKQVDLAGLVSENEQVADTAAMAGTMPQGTFHPAFKLEYGEKYTDSCLVVDIPIELFNKIAPCYDDLQWLGHVREIQPSNKQSAKYIERLKSSSTSTSLPKISTVISNRMPVSGAQSIACLVSFENWAKYLPDNNGVQSSAIPAGTQFVRMVLFKQWQFFAVSRNQTFSGYLLNLNKKDGEFTGGLLQLPASGGTTDADAAIDNAFNMGYVPLNHHTRQGDNTVSWYKGPFLPYRSAGEITIPVNGSDSCTAYNPDTGMFDISYAAAWQLGRLLGLQNGNFATTLYNWKRANTQAVISNFEEEIIKKTLKEIVDNGNPAPVAASMIEGNLGPDVLQLMNKSLTQILSQFINNKDSGSAIETK